MQLYYTNRQITLYLQIIYKNTYLILAASTYYGTY